MSESNVSLLPTTPPAALASSASEAVRHALQNAGYEVLPLRGAEEKVLASVPRELPLSVTMTATKGLHATIDLAERLTRHGYRVTPHIAARMVRDRAELADVVDRLAANRIDSIFVIAGDVPTAAGSFSDSIELLDTLATTGHHFTRIGVGGYPEGHGTLSPQAIASALDRKAHLATYIVTQMCFRSETTVAWARGLRRRGITLPVYAGLPGAVTRQKLVRISASLGLGPSARYLLKQNNLLLRFFLPGGYRPDRLVTGLGSSLTGPAPAVAGLHLFTFNELARTEAWRQAWLTRLRWRGNLTPVEAA
ncbi:MAG: 5,10-methylenetetrahydrofolate reductase [Mycobacterium sp.]|nr:5,10-methylenetetrahydrofolate reductase [Mycobacterium sp.]